MLINNSEGNPPVFPELPDHQGPEHKRDTQIYELTCDIFEACSNLDELSKTLKVKNIGEVEEKVREGILRRIRENDGIEVIFGVIRIKPVVYLCSEIFEKVKEVYKATSNPGATDDSIKVWLRNKAMDDLITKGPF